MVLLFAGLEGLVLYRLVVFRGRPNSMYVVSLRYWADSWVWEEKGAFEIVNSPHKVGEEAPTEWNPSSEGKRSDPWVK